MNNQIQGWTPKTDFLLRYCCGPSNNHDHDNAELSSSSDDDNRPHHHGGYDIIDHAFGHNFPSDLLKELQSNGWIDDGIKKKGKLAPARTKMDVDLDNYLLMMQQSFANNPFMSTNDDGNGNTAAAAAALSNNGNAASSARGDESAFISRRERMKGTFPERYPMLHTFVDSIEGTACKRLGKSTTTPVGRDHASKTTDGSGTITGVPPQSSDNAPYFEFDTSLTSVQIAKYPGDGQAGYPRHCDRGATCLKEPPSANINTNTIQDTKTTTDPPKRILTFVYYLTPNEWDSELDGGALRIFPPFVESSSDRNSSGKNSSDKSSSSSSGSVHDAHYFDVTPYADRLVAFRSDLIEHQVMPSLRRDRIAITVWLYGRVVCRGGCSNTETVSLPSSNGLGGKRSSSNHNNGVCTDDNNNRTLPPPLPLSPDNAEKTITATERGGDKTIYVAIPSYRDEETWPTIKSLVASACHPERVFVGVVFQVDTFSQEEVQRFTTSKGSGISLESPFQWSEETHIRSITLDCRHATGPCYARHLAQTLHRGEDYVLQIDSHMRFRPNWDEYLIQQLNMTKCPEKSVLTAYPPGYEPPNGPGSDAETRATILVPWKFGQEDGILRQKGRLLCPGYQHGLSDNGNIPCLLYAGGFNFFHSSLVDVCPYDSKLHGLFFGEEISMAVRLYTHGFDLYAPPHTVCYHLWKRNPLRAKKVDASDMAKQREDVLEVVRMQLRGMGRGLGTIRSVEQFSKELGVDFDRGVLASGCEDAGLSEDRFVPTASLSTAAGEDAKTCNGLGNEDMSSVLKLVGQYMNGT